MFRAFATVGGFTMASRILGFVRDIMVARLVGAGPLADAFFIAFRLPNLFRRFFAEGAFNAAFVPIFTRTLEEEGNEAARRFAQSALMVLTLFLVSFSIAAEIWMEGLMALLAPGFADDPIRGEKAVLYGRIMFPYLTFMSLMALYGGVLNALMKFAAAAAAPIMLNVVLIIVLLFVAPRAEDPGQMMAVGVTIGGVMQLLWVVVALERAGLGLRVGVPEFGQKMRRLFVLMGPSIVAGGVTQINIVVGSIIASLQDGAMSYLYYADRVYQLPLGVIGAGMGVVLLPTLTRALRSGNPNGARHQMNRATEMTLALALPASIALAAMPLLLTIGLFERGAFDRETSHATAAALQFFALGVPAFVLQRVFQAGYFAQENTKTPLIFASVNMAINIALSLYLFPRMGHVGIAIATTVAGWVHLLLLIGGLLRNGDFTPDKQLIQRLLRLGVAAGLMGAALWFGERELVRWFDQPDYIRIGLLLGMVGAGGALYGALALGLRAFTLGDLKALVRRSA